ncbi:Low-density lipoprotein receptor-related protein 3 [Tupaia chinensis]|uniref:Low-density lipoprotein receptor-related protein 3 n=1 Tax=Tupaia chinensis TaxID=246437 RepID=L8Y7B7_TUPCH|nr:Low-density lipoprotein receptor-related protein 3 [Tupaia chinensis]
MAAPDSDSDEDLVSYGTGLEPLEEGWTPSTFVSSRQNRADKSVLGPEDFMDEEDEDDDYLPDNVTFAPKDVTPVDFTPKDNVHGLAYKGLDPRQALFGTSGEHFNLFGAGPEESSNLLEDVGLNKGRKLGISGQAFGVGALEEEDDDIYALETLSKYDTVLKDEEPGDGLYGWTAPKQYRNQKGLATSVLEFLSQKDKERIKEMKQATDLKAAQLKARNLAQMASSSRPQPFSPDMGLSSRCMALGGGTATATASNFRPFAKDPEKQKRYEEFLVHMKQGQKDALEQCLDPSMTEWERGRERDEFARAALLYVSPHSTLSSRFTHAKEEDDSDQVEVPRDQETVNKGVDSQTEEESSRPSMDLFRAIFASSSDEKSSSSEDEQGDSEDDQPDAGEASFKDSQEADMGETPSVAHANEPAPCEPAPPFPIQKLQIDEREEFGPRLPPVFCPNARQKPEVPQKEKHKKNKEKHKTKKEHSRRKKEKKKKHKKHKHKGKQKNKRSEKSSTSESSDSSDSRSDEDGTADMSPQELLRRALQRHNRLPWVTVVKALGGFRLSTEDTHRDHLLASLDPLDVDRDFLVPKKDRKEEKTFWGDQEPLSKIPFKILSGHEHVVSSCHFCVDDTKLLSGSYDSTVKLWDAVDGSVIQDYEPHPKAPILECSITADYRRIVAASYDKTVRAWDLETGKLLWKMSHDNFVVSCKFSPDGKYVVAGLDVDRGIFIMDAENTATVSHIKDHHSRSITACCFDPDSQRVVSVSLDRSIKIWDVTSRTTLLTITKAHSNAISNCCFTFSGHFLCTSSWDKNLKIWNVHTGEFRNHGACVTLMQGHEGCVSCCSFARDTACSGKLEQHTERRGVIYSPAWPLNYPPGTNCSWYIQGDRGDMITISFRNFDVEESHQCSLDWLVLGPAAPPRQEAFRLCGSAIPPAFISARDHGWIFFHSDASSSGQAQGFRLSYIRGKLGQASCQADEFRCDNGKCLPGPWQCNTVDECGDGSDEGNCSAPASEPPGSLCPGGTFPCSGARSTRCLPVERRCDGTQDCGDGSDEAGCPDLACGRRLGSFYGSFASPDLFGAARGPSDLHCTWLVDTQDPRRVLLQQELRLGYDDYVQVYEGLGERGDRLLQTLSYRSNHRPVSLEAAQGRLTVAYHARARSAGHGFNATYQVKGYCLPWEQPCGSSSEGDGGSAGDQGCFSEPQRCDGWWHCASGRDEQGCPACPPDQYPCEGGSGLCYSPADRCNNQKSCPDGADEKNCFSCQPGTFHCGTNLAFETQMTRLEAEFVRREAPPSYGQLIAQGLIPPVEDFPVYSASQASVLQNLRRQMPRAPSRRGPSRRRLGRLWNRLFHRPRAPRGQIPLLTAARTSQTVLGDGLLQPAGTTPDPPAPLTDTDSPRDAGDGPPSAPGQASEVGPSVPPMPSGLRDPECRPMDKDRKAIRDPQVDSPAPADTPREPCLAQAPYPQAPTASSTLGPHSPEPPGACRSPLPPCSPALEASDDEALLVC